MIDSDLEIAPDGIISPSSFKLTSGALISILQFLAIFLVVQLIQLYFQSIQYFQFVLRSINRFIQIGCLTIDKSVD